MAGAAGAGARQLSESIVMANVLPGDEAHVCVTKRLTNDRDVWVKRMHATISDGSHHLIVDRARSERVSSTPLPCIPLTGTDASRLLIAQQHETLFELPADVAYKLPAFQLVTLELHYVNTTRNPITIEANVRLDVEPEGWQPKAEAIMKFTGTLGVSIPPHARATSRHFEPLGGGTDTAHVFAATSHTHSRGIRSVIERVASATARGDQVHESLDWAEPPLSTFEPPLVFSGGDGLRLECEFQNDSDQTIKFGSSVDDEMCFMWLYYYVPGARF